MLWADVSWSERIAGLSGFHKLLVIPLLLAQFRRSPHANWVILGFLASSVVAAGRLVGAGAHARAVVARQGTRRAGQELHPAERHLCDLRVRAIRASRRAVAHAPPPRCDAPCSCGGVHRQYWLCGDGAHHPRGPGGDGGSVRAAAVRLERRGWCLPDRSRYWPGRCGHPRPICARAFRWRSSRCEPMAPATSIPRSACGSNTGRNRLPSSPKHLLSGMGQERFRRCSGATRPSRRSRR